MRAVAIVAVLVLVGLAVWLLRSKPADRVDDRARASQPRSAEVAVRPTPAIAEPDRPEPDRDATAPASAASVRSEAPSAVRSEQSLDEVIVGPADGSLVRGTVVVVDEQGREHADRDGVLEPWFDPKSSGVDDPDIEVRHGRFAVRVPKDHPLGIRRLELGGCAAKSDVDRFDVAAGDEITVRAAWARPVVVHVVDAAAGAELDDVAFVRVEDPEHEERIPATVAPEDVKIHGRSPFELHAPSEMLRSDFTQVYWVRALGGAWTRASLDFATGEPVTVKVESSAELDVRVFGRIPTEAEIGLRRGRDQPCELVIRLFESKGGSSSELQRLVTSFLQQPRETRAAFGAEFAIFTEQELRDEMRRELDGMHGPLIAEAEWTGPDPTTFRSLRPGPCVVKLQVRSSYRESLTLADADLTLTAGRTSSVDLSIAPPDPLVPLSGSLRFSTAWNGIRPSLHFHSLTRPTNRLPLDVTIEPDEIQPGGAAGIGRWNLGEVPRGSYVVLSPEFMLAEILDTGPSGNTSAELHVPDPADVVLHVLDASSSEPRGGAIRWTCKGPPELRGMSWRGASWNEEDRTWRFRAPATELELLVLEEEFVESLRPVPLSPQPGLNELTVRLHRACGIALRLSVSEPQKEPFSRSIAFVKIERLDGGGAQVLEEPLDFFASDEVRSTWQVSSPGLYRVTLPGIPGFLPIPSFEVRVEDGSFTEHEVELTRAR